MNRQQYESLSDDLKLDAKLGIVLGKKILFYSGYLYRDSLVRALRWKPRQDPAILWGLIGSDMALSKRGDNSWQVTVEDQIASTKGKTKEEALIAAYCASDPLGNWAKWCKENEVMA